MKKLVYKLYFELYTIEGSKDVIVKKIKGAVYEAWEQISDQFLYSLIDSMIEWVKAVRKARGGYT